MPGIPPFFFTGGNAKLKVNGVVLAFCTDLSYSVRTPHIQTHVLGMYEPTSLEPLAYKVSGTFTVVRYMNSVKGTLENANYKTPARTVDSGNGIGTWSDTGATGTVDTILRNSTLSNDGRVYESFDPSKMQNGTYFDIEVYQKMPDGVVGDRGVAHIRNCRITGSDFRVVKKSTALQTFTFEALYLDEDSFVADFSGQGQQFS